MILFSRITLLLSLLAIFPAVFGVLEDHYDQYRLQPECPAATDTATKFSPVLRFPYGSTKVRGVNLGGWLVLEPWITPSLFENTGNNAVVDEYTFGQFQDWNIAETKLKAHWDTWITRSDFAAIAAAGLNHVRIPIGYWAFDISAGEPYHSGQYPYLLKAIKWATRYGIKVWIDLHGAPGSQNGFDNSGRRGDTKWHTNPVNVARTNAIIKSLATEFSKDEYADSVVAIAPLNEPAGFVGGNMMDVVRQYWYDSYGNIRYPFGSSDQGPLLEVIHDAFQSLNSWNGFMTYPRFEGVAMDTHHYEIFSNDGVAMSWNQHLQTACNFGRKTLPEYASSNLWTIVGEFSTAAYDCAKYINGRGRGSRYDGTFPGSTRLGHCYPLTGGRNRFSNEYKRFLRQFYEAQISSFEQGAQGWIYWTWKAENADEWSYQAGIAGGWIPTDPSEREFPDICG
ncbi:putative EXG1-exo-beta-1,3-glucanase, major isoform [Ceratobasidium sp. AG-I]|nr:putative EXG1-exo-beta-1,3-glucanase, major isoform [Ceratobasidium sp. AG-I]